MRQSFKALRKGLVLGLVAAAGFTGIALAKRVVSFDEDQMMSVPAFAISSRPIGGTEKAAATAAYLSGARITAIGEQALVIDPDSGKLIHTDATGKSLSALDVGRDAGLLAYDPTSELAYVADRMNDRIAVVKVSADKLVLDRTWKTPVEPYGVALTPDRKLLLVTTIADRALVAIDTATGVEKWRTPLGREPRGIAVSADGARAVVAYLATGTVDEIDLATATHSPNRVALSTTAVRRSRRGGEGESFARGSFAVTFMGSSEAVVPFQRETPVQAASGSERTSSYGGGFEPPVTHQVAFIGFGKTTPSQAVAQIAVHQPRALAWDGAHDALYIAGLGNDSMLQLKNASTSTISQGMTIPLGNGVNKCGPDGIAVTASGDLMVWCSFTRTIARVDMIDDAGKPMATVPKIAFGLALAPTRMTEKQHIGFVTFHSSEPAVSQRGAMACATCHPDNRADGLSWRIEKKELQTPILAGRVVGTHPYKWDGNDQDLKTSLAMTMKRLGGFGLEPKQAEALQAYVEMLPNVRPPSRDVAMVGRGKKLFEATDVGCRQCHDGAMYTDNAKHKFTGSLSESDTPSLLGLAASAPYFHDGSAPTLEAVLRDRGSVHGMTDTSKLTDAQVADLTAFLETL